MCKISEAKLNCWVGRIALAVSFLIFVCFGACNLSKFSIENWGSILWCVSWALLGLGVSLEGSTPEKVDVNLIKRSLYYGLVVFIAVYVSYGFCSLNKSNWFSASLLAFIIGVSGNNLFGILKIIAERWLTKRAEKIK